jgi:PPM family protein phosphatase
MEKFQVSSSGNTHVGQVRSANQDAFLNSDSKRLYAVADGMGGHAGGEIASQLCIKEIEHHLEAMTARENFPRNHPDIGVMNTLAKAINAASTKIYERALEEPFLKGMGTTATALAIIDNQAYFGHVGDSRLYLLRAGFIYQLTNDHSLVSEQVRSGALTKEEAEMHHLRNVITRSVGYQEEEEVDTGCITIEAGDKFVLCTDGLHGKIADREISKSVHKNPVESPKMLISMANSRGGEDNITAVVVEIKVSAK